MLFHLKVFKVLSVHKYKIILNIHASNYSSLKCLTHGLAISISSCSNIPTCKSSIVFSFVREKKSMCLKLHLRKQCKALTTTTFSFIIVHCWADSL